MWKKFKKGWSGFTLVEIMIVIAMLGIITAIAIPRLVSNDRTDMNPLQQLNNDKMNYQSSDTSSHEINQLGPRTYEVWVKECNKFIKITISDVGG